MDTNQIFNARPQCAKTAKALTELMEGLEPGDQLPQEPDMAHQFGVSRHTLREVLRRFCEAGLLRQRQGSGTFLAAPIPTLEIGLETLESLEQTAKRLGVEMDVARLAVAERDATGAELAGLGWAPGKSAQVLVVERVMTAAGQPVADLCDIVPVTYLRQVGLGDDFRGAVLDILLQRSDLLPLAARTDIAIESGAVRSSARLNVQRSAALLKLTTQLYTGDHQIVDYSTGYFVPGYFKFHVIRKVVKQ